MVELVSVIYIPSEAITSGNAPPTICTVPPLALNEPSLDKSPLIVNTFEGATRLAPELMDNLVVDALAPKVKSPSTYTSPSPEVPVSVPVATTPEPVNLVVVVPKPVKLP